MPNVFSYSAVSCASKLKSVRRESVEFVRTFDIFATVGETTSSKNAYDGWKSRLRLSLLSASNCAPNFNPFSIAYCARVLIDAVIQRDFTSPCSRRRASGLNALLLQLYEPSG